MRKLFEMICNGDENTVPFTTFERVFYGILLPLGLIALMGLAGWMESSF